MCCSNVIYLPSIADYIFKKTFTHTHTPTQGNKYSHERSPDDTERLFLLHAAAICKTCLAASENGFLC